MHKTLGLLLIDKVLKHIFLKLFLLGYLLLLSIHKIQENRKDCHHDSDLKKHLEPEFFNECGFHAIYVVTLFRWFWTALAEALFVDLTSTFEIDKWIVITTCFVQIEVIAHKKWDVFIIVFVILYTSRLSILTCGVWGFVNIDFIPSITWYWQNAICYVLRHVF